MQNNQNPYGPGQQPPYPPQIPYSGQPYPPAPPPKKGLSTGAILGIVFGGIAVLVVVALLVGLANLGSWLNSGDYGDYTYYDDTGSDDTAGGSGKSTAASNAWSRDDFRFYDKDGNVVEAASDLSVPDDASLGALGIHIYYLSEHSVGTRTLTGIQIGDTIEEVAKKYTKNPEVTRYGCERLGYDPFTFADWADLKDLVAEAAYVSEQVPYESDYLYREIHVISIMGSDFKVWAWKNSTPHWSFFITFAQSGSDAVVTEVSFDYAVN